MRRLSNKAKFGIVGGAFLLVAIAILLALAITLKWNIAGFFTHPIVIVCYFLIGIAAISIASILILKKIKGR